MLANAPDDVMRAAIVPERVREKRLRYACGG